MEKKEEEKKKEENKKDEKTQDPKKDKKEVAATSPETKEQVQPAETGNGELSGNSNQPAAQEEDAGKRRVGSFF